MFDDKFVEAIRTAFPAFKGELARNTTAAQVPGWDSFGHVELIFELEAVYEIEIDPGASLDCADVGTLYDMVKEKAGA